MWELFSTRRGVRSPCSPNIKNVRGANISNQLLPGLIGSVHFLSRLASWDVLDASIQHTDVIQLVIWSNIAIHTALCCADAKSISSTSGTCLRRRFGGTYGISSSSWTNAVDGAGIQAPEYRVNASATSPTITRSNQLPRCSYGSVFDLRLLHDHPQAG